MHTDRQTDDGQTDKAKVIFWASAGMTSKECEDHAEADVLVRFAGP